MGYDEVYLLVNTDHVARLSRICMECVTEDGDRSKAEILLENQELSIVVLTTVSEGSHSAPAGC